MVWRVRVPGSESMGTWFRGYGCIVFHCPSCVEGFLWRNDPQSQSKAMSIIDIVPPNEDTIDDWMNESMTGFE